MTYDDSAVLDAVHKALGEVNMTVTAERIAAAGRRRRNRRRGAGAVAGVAAIVGATVGIINVAGSTPTKHIATLGPAHRPASQTLNGVHIRTAAFTVDTQSDGTLRVTWDKQRYFDDRDALLAALRAAGFPVVMRVGEFCAAPGDDTTLDMSGVGPGVDRVMKGEPSTDGRVTFVFTPSQMPAGKELFIGYLDPEQLRATRGLPGSVERLVSADAPLTCTTTPPPGHP